MLGLILLLVLSLLRASSCTAEIPDKSDVVDIKGMKMMGEGWTCANLTAEYLGFVKEDEALMCIHRVLFCDQMAQDFADHPMVIECPEERNGEQLFLHQTYLYCLPRKNVPGCIRREDFVELTAAERAKYAPKPGDFLPNLDRGRGQGCMKWCLRIRRNFKACLYYCQMG